MAQQPVLEGFRPDLILKDSGGVPTIVEVQLNALDRPHFYRSIEYRDLLLEKGHNKVRVILVCNTIPRRYARLLQIHGVECVPIDKEFFINKIAELTPNVQVIFKATGDNGTQDYITTQFVLNKLKTKSTIDNGIDKNIFVMWTRSWKDTRDDNRYLNFVNLDEVVFEDNRAKLIQDDQIEYVSLPFEYMVLKESLSKLTAVRLRLRTTL